MPLDKITGLPAVATLTGGELIEVVQPGNAAQGVSKRATLNQLLTAAGLIPTGISVLAGTGLTGGGPLSTSVTLGIANTGVTAGTYGSNSAVAMFTVNAQGQLTSVTAVPITTSGIGGVPTSRQILAGTGISGGGDLTVDRTIALQNSGVAAATYGSGSAVAVITVDAQGRLSQATTALITSSNIGAVPTTRQVLAGTGMSGGGSLATDVTLALGNTGVAAATYGSGSAVAVITVDAQGRLSQATTALITSSNIGAVPTTRQITSGTGLSGGGDLSIDRSFLLANTAVVAGSYGSSSAVATFTVNAQGQLTAAAASVITASAIGGVPTTRQITSGTGLSGGGNLTVDRSFLIANTAVTAGTYGSSSAVATFTVNAQGQITAASGATITASAIGGVPTTRQITSGTGLSGGGDLTVDRSFLIANTGVTAGTYGSSSATAQLTVNAQGQITAVTMFSISTGGAGISTLTASTGLSGGGSASTVALGIANTAVTAGAYGSGTNIATFTVNAQGQITAAASTSGVQAQLGLTQTYTRGQAGQVTAFSGTVASPAILDLSVSNNWSMLATSGFVLGKPINIAAGTSGVIAVSQSSSGNCAITFQSGWVTSGGGKPTLTTSSGAVDVLTYYALSASSVLVSANLAVA